MQKWKKETFFFFSDGSDELNIEITDINMCERIQEPSMIMLIFILFMDICR